MRLNILVLGLLSSAAAAQAGSIDVITTGNDTPRSVERIICASCVKTAKKEVPSVVELAPGTQKVEIREVNGVRKIFRTESWNGGSPVVFVSKAVPGQAPVVADSQPVAADDVAAVPAATTSEQPAVSAEADMIDEKSTTAAVTADIGAEIKVEVTPKARAFDPSKLELRLN